MKADIDSLQAELDACESRGENATFPARVVRELIAEIRALRATGDWLHREREASFERGAWADDD